MSNKILIVFIALLGMVLNKVNAHPLHLTLTNIVISDDSLLVSVLLNGHDLEHAIEAYSNKSIIYENIVKDTEVQHIVNQYLESNIIISFDGQTILLNNWLCKVENEKVRLTFKKNIKVVPGEVGIKNTLFLNTHGEARNMLILSANNFEKGIEFNEVETKKTITLVK